MLLIKIQEGVLRVNIYCQDVKFCTILPVPHAVQALLRIYSYPGSECLTSSSYLLGHFGLAIIHVFLQIMTRVPLVKFPGRGWLLK